MSEQAPDRIWSGIQITKVAAGTLAAVSAAVIGSFLGVAGTLAGAAIASIVGSVGTELYQRSLDRGAKKLQTIAPTFIKAPAAVGTPPVPAARDEMPATAAESQAATTTAGDPAAGHSAAEDKAGDTAGDTAATTTTAMASTAGDTATTRTLPWKRIGLAAALLFVLALGSLSVVELLAGKSVASMVGNSGGRTTLSSVVGDDRGERTEREEPAPATSESAPAEEPAGEPTDAPTDAPTTDQDTEPTTEPTTEPATEPTTEPTEAPATDTPEQQAPAVDEQQQPREE